MCVHFPRGLQFNFNKTDRGRAAKTSSKLSKAAPDVEAGRIGTDYVNLCDMLNRLLAYCIMNCLTLLLFVQLSDSSERPAHQLAATVALQV